MVLDTLLAQVDSSSVIRVSKLMFLSDSYGEPNKVANRLHNYQEKWSAGGTLAFLNDWCVCERNCYGQCLIMHLGLISLAKKVRDPFLHPASAYTSFVVLTPFGRRQLCAYDFHSDLVLLLNYYFLKSTWVCLCE